MIMKKTLIPLVILILSCFPIKTQEMSVADIFTDNMVLQQKTLAPVWGTARPGSAVKVTPSWNGEIYKAVTGKDARWKVMVATPEAGGPYTLTIAGEKDIILHNILIGEVWLASGQSNMSMPLKGYYCQPVTGSNEAILSSGSKNIHFINIPTLAAYKPQEHINAKWTTASIETTSECSAVAWFFADFLQSHLGVPIGIINASNSGSNIEAWMNSDACKKNPDISVPAESDITSESINNVPTVLYNGMIHPLEGYGIRGVIWYQGESNVFNVTRYGSWFSSMVEGWRSKWNEGDFPFYFAQIAPYDYREWNFFTPEFPEISAYIREAQMECISIIPNCGMAVLLDLGDPYLIHPPRKKEAGDRLGLLALSKTYGYKGFEAESPRYDSMKVEGNKVYLYFKNQFNGITNYGKPLNAFEIAGENRQFVKADATIDGEKGIVVVSSHLVSKPVSVRYAFKNYVDAELFGNGGLPVSSFRTDRWK
jgi:sialate O-acetylesterase